jgi:hypothetical protein
VSFIGNTFAKWRRQREAIEYAKAYHADSRARGLHLVAAGKGQEGLRDNLSMMGIDTTKAERPRLRSIGGVNF